MGVPKKGRVPITHKGKRGGENFGTIPPKKGINIRRRGRLVFCGRGEWGGDGGRCWGVARKNQQQDRKEGRYRKSIHNPRRRKQFLCPGPIPRFLYKRGENSCGLEGPKLGSVWW